MKLSSAVAAALLLGSLALAQDATETPDMAALLADRAFERDGARLRYRALEPAESADGERHPLVIFLHGIGERGTDNTRQLCNGVERFVSAEARRKHPCFLVVPQCPPDAMWSPIRGTRENPTFAETPTAPAALLLGLVEELVQDPRVDPDRVYITGLSMGGYGTWDLAARRPELFAAALPVCGGGDPARAGALAGLPIWCFHGGADALVPPERSRAMIEALSEAGAEAKYTEYEGVGHDSWTRTYGDPEVLEWLFGQKRKPR